MKNNSPQLTIFTAPKPFKDPHITTIQYNAIRSWKQLLPEVSVVLIGDEDGIESAAKDLGVYFIADVKRNKQGTPLISSIFKIGRSVNDSPLLAYINSDIIIFNNFLHASILVNKQLSHFLLIGQRWDMDITGPIDFGNGWERKLLDNCRASGKLHKRAGSDYFIFPRTTFSSIPDFAVGRAGWDNWMIYNARLKKWPCVDASKTIKIIHQTHDYSHLPDGQRHYRLPETNENVRLAGGRRTIFTLMDVDFEISNSLVKKYPFSWKKFWREIEIFPLISLKMKWLANIFFTIFHPKKAYLEFRNYVSSRMNKDR